MEHPDCSGYLTAEACLKDGGDEDEEEEKEEDWEACDYLLVPERATFELRIPNRKMRSLFGQLLHNSCD